MASELHEGTRYKLSICVDRTLDACLPQSSAVAGDRFFNIHLYYKHIISNSNHSDLPPQQLYSFSHRFTVSSQEFFRFGPKAVNTLLSSGVGLQYLPDDDAVAGFAPVISRFAASVVAFDWMTVVPVRMTVTANTVTDGFHRARRFYSRDILCACPSTAFDVKALKAATADEARGRCSICSEDFVVDDDHDHRRHLDFSVVKMPCLHVYHPECIVQWLVKSSMCPLCRQAMPSSSLA